MLRLAPVPESTWLPRGLWHLKVVTVLSQAIGPQVAECLERQNDASILCRQMQELRLSLRIPLEQSLNEPCIL